MKQDSVCANFILKLELRSVRLELSLTGVRICELKLRHCSFALVVVNNVSQHRAFEINFDDLSIKD